MRGARFCIKDRRGTVGVRVSSCGRLVARLAAKQTSSGLLAPRPLREVLEVVDDARTFPARRGTSVERYLLRLAALRSGVNPLAVVRLVSGDRDPSEVVGLCCCHDLLPVPDRKRRVRRASALCPGRYAPNPPAFVRQRTSACQIIARVRAQQRPYNETSSNLLPIVSLPGRIFYDRFVDLFTGAFH